MSPNPRSRINSAGDDARIAMQLSTTASGNSSPWRWRRRLSPQGLARQSVARTKALVALLQDLQHLGRGQLILQFTGRVVRILNLVTQLVLSAEAAQADLHAMSRRNLFLEVAEQVEHVRIDVVRIGGVEQHMAAARHVAQNLLQRRPVEKTDLAGKMDVQNISAEMSLDDTTDRLAQVAAQDERDAHCHANQDPHEQIGGIRSIPS